MLFEFSGICQNCAESVRTIIHDGELQGRCPACGMTPFGLERIPGLVYVVSNPNQVGVKVGMTTKSIQQRIKSLNSTGVVGSFEPIVVFPSKNPKKDEKRVHDKLARSKIAKEHFDVDPVEAALKAYRALGKRQRPIFFSDDVEKEFDLRDKKARIEMQLRIGGKKKR